MRNRFLLLTLLLVAGCFRLCVAQNLGIHPTTLNFTLTNGQSETQVINISNGSAKKVQYRLYLNDWLRDTTGGHIYYEPNSISRSCSRWLTVNKNFVELEPGQSVQISVKMTVPDSSEASSEMKWSMLFIETVEEQVNQASKTASATVRNLLRLGVHIYQTPPNVNNKELKVYDLKAAATPANTYQIYCENTGGVMVDCKSYIEITSPDGKKSKLEPVEFPMFPSQKRYVTFELPKNLPKGKYSALAVVDGGEDMSLEAVESQIEVK